MDLTALDVQLFLYLNQLLNGPVLTPLFIVLTFGGNGLVLAALIVPLMAKYDRPKLKRHLGPMLVALIAAALVVNGLKIVINRPRPPIALADSEQAVIAPLGTPPDKSMPSGHTQTGLGAAVYLSCIYPLAAPLFLTGGLLVGFSRIALGVHYPSDVLVGGAFGAVFSLMVFWWRKRRTT